MLGDEWGLANSNPTPLGTNPYHIHSSPPNTQDTRINFKKLYCFFKMQKIDHKKMAGKISILRD